MGVMLGEAARLEIDRDDAVSDKLVEPGMCLHHCIAGSRQRMRGILNPLAAVRLRQSARNIAHNCA